MKFTAQQIRKLEHFLSNIEAQTYPEPVEEIHQGITEQMMDRLFQRYPMSTGSSVLDVGCGQGVALEKFTALGLNATGITLNKEDVSICQQKGFNVHHMDQSFLSMDDNSFDLVWNRHCIEHSIFPLFTLVGLHAVLKPGGLLYLEMPGVDTTGKHETNPNHYSILGKSMWVQLIARSGFEMQEMLDLDFISPAGEEKYMAFIAKK